MTKVIIAYGSLDWFWQTCADLVRECAVARNLAYEQLSSDSLTKENVAASIDNGNSPNVLTAFSHGNIQGYTNDEGDCYVDIKDDLLYKLAGHVVYSTTCWSGCPDIVAEMKRKGVKAYWGYDNKFRYVPTTEFARCSVAGIVAMLEGESVAESKKKMEAEFSQYKADNILSTAIVEDDMRRLVVFGDEDFKLAE